MMSLIAIILSGCIGFICGTIWGPYGLFISVPVALALGLLGATADINNRG